MIFVRIKVWGINKGNDIFPPMQVQIKKEDLKFQEMYQDNPMPVV